MAPNDTYPNPNTNSSTSSNLNPITEVPTPPAPKKHKGVRCRTSGGYVAEIRHAKGRTWLGTFVTANEAAFAYDLAAQKLRGTTYNFDVGADNQIITTIDPAKQAAIGKTIEEKLGANPRSSADIASQRAETSHKRKWTRKSGNDEFQREPNARKKREVEKKQRDVDLEGFL